MDVRRSRSRAARIGALLVMGSLVITACTSGATSTPTAGQPTVAPTDTATAQATGAPTEAATEAATPQATEAATAEATGAATSEPTAGATDGAAAACAGAADAPITLTEWDQEVREGIGPAVEQLNREFMDANPGVTIARESKSFDDLKATVLQALTDPNGPDIAQVNQGRPDMGAAVQAGLLLPLDDYATEYGWTDRWSEGVLARNSFSTDGREFGTGSLYGVSITGEIVGLYYNKQKSTDLGLTVPASWAEFEEQLGTIRDAGEVPIAFGDQGGGGSIQVYGSILETMVTPEYLNDWIFGRNDQSFATPETEAAAMKLVELSDEGAFTEGYSGITIDDASVAFAGGEGVYLWGGSWYGAGLVEAAGENFGFLRVPPQEEGGAALSIGGVGLPWAIRATSPNADCAAAYLDHLTSDHAMELVAQAGVLPGHEAPSAEGPGDLFNEMAAAFADANDKDEVGHYLDWAFAGGYDVFNAELAELLGKQQSPADFVQAIDTAYQEFLTTLE